MIFVSLHPFVFKRIFAFAAATICLSLVSCFASSSIFVPVQSSPYDRQMTRILPALLAKSSTGQELSLSLVNSWMGDLRGIPYHYDPEWKTPDEVQSNQAADCKGKAVALYQRMQRNGARNVRLVIGKRTPTSRLTHAWLIWESNGDTFVLDPTFNWMACRPEQLGERSYLALYAYSGEKKFRALSSELYAQN